MRGGGDDGLLVDCELVVEQWRVETAEHLGEQSERLEADEIARHFLIHQATFENQLVHSNCPETVTETNFECIIIH